MEKLKKWRLTPSEYEADFVPRKGDECQFCGFIVRTLKNWMFIQNHFLGLRVCPGARKLSFRYSYLNGLIGEDHES